MQRSTFKVLFYVKRQSEKSGQIPVMAVLRSTVRCRSSAANSPFVLLFGIPRQIKQPAKASKPNASTECLRLLRIYRFKLCERFETDPYRYSYRRQRGSLDHRQASEDGYLSGDRAFPLKGTYNTLNMSLRHVTRHAGCRSIRRSMWPGIHLPRRSRSRRAYRWKPYRRCWDINISPRPKFTPKSPTTRSDKI